MGNKLNLSDPTFLTDRRKNYRTLRTTTPVAVSELNGEEVVVLTRYRDVDALLRDPRARVQPAAGEFPSHLGNGPASLFYRLSLPSMDAPDHMRLRKVLTPALGPPAVARMEKWVAEIIERRLDEVGDKSVIDAVEQFGNTIPADVPCRLLHIPPEDAELLVSRVDELNAVFSQSDMGVEALARTDDAGRFFFGYFEELIERHQGLPEEDFLGALIKAEERGQMNREELTTALIDVFMGSYHTTKVSLTNAINALALYPEQRAALIADPFLAARAWEEVLRFDTPIHFRHRYVSEPLTIHDHPIQPRVRVLLGLASANWDETIFENPDVFDISRPPNRHFAFGGGGHFCLGAQLSRLEGRLFLPMFLSRFPDFRLVDLPHPRYNDLTFVFAKRLTIELIREH
jgi:cytochrome P450